jgi:hypothetical protein
VNSMRRSCSDQSARLGQRNRQRHSHLHCRSSAHHRRAGGMRHHRPSDHHRGDADRSTRRRVRSRWKDGAVTLRRASP